MQINLRSGERIVGADRCFTTVETLQLEQLRRVSAGNVGVDVDVQKPVAAGIAHHHQGLERRIVEQIAATDPLDQRVGEGCGNNRIPVCGVFHLVRTGLSA